MKITRQLIGTATMGLGLLAAGNLRAQSNPLSIQFKLTATVQSTTTTNGDSYNFKATKVRIGNKEILDLLGAATTNDFTGATLVVASRSQGVFQVVNGSTVLADVSRFFTLDGSTNYVITGTASDKTSKYNFKYSWIKSIKFDDSRGNSFTVRGNEIDVLKAGAVRNGHQTFVENSKLKGVGEGRVGETVGMFSGTVKMARKTTS